MDLMQRVFGTDVGGLMGEFLRRRGATAFAVVALIVTVATGLLVAALVISGRAEIGFAVMIGFLVLVSPALVVPRLFYRFYRLWQALTWAVGVGWRFVGSDQSLLERWRDRPFTGHAQRVSELVVGTFAGRSAMSFVLSGGGEVTRRFHVVAVELRASLPTLELTPDGPGATLAKAAGGEDIQFESEDFNRAWRVRADDRRFAHDVVNPQVMERLLRDDARGLSLRIEGSDILCWTPGEHDLDAIWARLQLMSDVVGAVPRFVWLACGYDPGAPPPPIGVAWSPLPT